MVDTQAGSHLSRAEQAAHEAQDAQLVVTGMSVRYETTAWHRDGTLRDVVMNKLLLPAESGRPGRIRSVLVDVTELRLGERATREARDAAADASRLKSLADAAVAVAGRGGAVAGCEGGARADDSPIPGHT